MSLKTLQEKETDFSTFTSNDSYPVLPKDKTPFEIESILQPKLNVAKVIKMVWE